MSSESFQTGHSTDITDIPFRFTELERRLGSDGIGLWVTCNSHDIQIIKGTKNSIGYYEFFKTTSSTSDYQANVLKHYENGILPAAVSQNLRIKVSNCVSVIVNSRSTRLFGSFTLQASRFDGTYYDVAPIPHLTFDDIIVFPTKVTEALTFIPCKLTMDSLYTLSGTSPTPLLPTPAHSTVLTNKQLISFPFNSITATAKQADEPKNANSAFEFENEDYIHEQVPKAVTPKARTTFSFLRRKSGAS